MNFTVMQNGKEIKCDIIKAFRDDGNNINYIIYTDGTKDETGELEIYASRYIQENDEFILHPIEHESEWNLIDNVLESKYKEIDKYE